MTSPKSGGGRSRTVVIDCFPSSVARYRDDHTVVAVDVIRATTLAVTTVATGRRCLVAANLADALAMRAALGDAILAGELSGDMPDGFDMNNSPADLVGRSDLERPVVMLSTSGTELILEAAQSPQRAYVACFRNVEAIATALISGVGDVALIGAGSRGEFREEDQMCCAWIAERLVDAGFDTAEDGTSELIRRWSGQPATACASGKSVAYLRRSGQLRDYDFITSHVDDLDLVSVIEGRDVIDGGREKARNGGAVQP